MFLGMKVAALERFRGCKTILCLRTMAANGRRVPSPFARANIGVVISLSLRWMSILADDTEPATSNQTDPRARSCASWRDFLGGTSFDKRVSKARDLDIADTVSPNHGRSCEIATR